MARTKRRIKAKQAPAIEPVEAQARANGAQLDRSDYVITRMPSPYGNGTDRVVKKQRHYETLLSRGVLDESLRGVLDWYTDRLALGRSGLVRSMLDIGAGIGGNGREVTSNARIDARSDVDWALRRVIKHHDERRAFVGVMGDMDHDGDMGFSEIGAQLWPRLHPVTARQKASTAFKLAANRLLLAVPVCGAYF